jgi:hypothetical protein
MRQAFPVQRAKVCWWHKAAESEPGSLRQLLRSKLTNYWMAASIVWVLGTLLVFLVFDPFGRSAWRDQEFFKFSTILLGPSALGLLALALVAWAEKR